MHRDRKRHTRQTSIYRDTQRKKHIQRHEKEASTETHTRKKHIQRHAEKEAYTKTRETSIYRDTFEKQALYRDTH